MDGNATTTRLHGHDVTRLKAKRCHVRPAHRHRRHGLKCIKHHRATRHAAGMPVFELTASDQHKRKILIRPFVGRDDVGRHQMHTAVSSRKAVDKNSRRARVVGTQAGVGHAGLALKSLPGDARDGGVHGLAHLFVHRSSHRPHACHFVCCAATRGGHALLGAARRGGAIAPIQAHLYCELLDDPQIRPGFARRRDRLPAHLHHAVGVADGTGLFGPGGGGQHHIGQPGSFGHEDVLHHQMLKAGKRVACVVQVRVTHGRVFAHDVHAANLVRVAVGGQRLVHDLDHGVTGFLIEFGVPEFFKPLVSVCVIYTLVIGEHHWNQPCVAGALHIVLAAQRVQAGAGLSDLPGHGAQRNQAACVVGAVYMLAHAHAPQNHCGFGPGELACDFPQGFSRYAANRRHGFGAIGLDVIAQRFKIAGAITDERFVGQPFVNDRVDQRVEHCHIGVCLELQRAPRVFADIGAARVGQDNFGALLRSVFHKGRSDRVVRRRVGADDKNQVRMLDIVDLVADRTRANPFKQGRNT